jgi:hypothetical protein
MAVERRTALGAFQSYYLRGDTRAAQVEFERARAELRSTGARDWSRARTDSLRDAAASLEFDNCPGFEKLRADAGAEELAYADFCLARMKERQRKIRCPGWSRTA